MRGPDCDDFDPTWPEPQRAAFFQAHKTHGCLWGNPVEAVPVKPRRLSTVLTFRVHPHDMDAIRKRIRPGQTLSDWLRELIHKPEPIRLPSDIGDTPGTASCSHIAVGNVTSASCSICGPLPVRRVVVT